MIECSPKLVLITYFIFQSMNEYDGLDLGDESDYDDENS